MQRHWAAFAAALAVVAAALPAQASPVTSMSGTFGSGFKHVFTGPDHLIAAVAVGLWAALLGGRALWSLPVCFLSAMATGFALAVSGMPLPMAEPMVIASVLFFGGIIAYAVRLPLTDALAAVFLLGLYHGSAHGTEISPAGVLADGAGLLFASANLHAIGVGTGLWLLRWPQGKAGLNILSAIGAATAGVGLLLVFTSA